MINIPTVKPGESQSNWMKRCVPILRHEGYPDKQSVAICYSIWRKKHPSSKKSADLSSLHDRLCSIQAYLNKLSNKM